MSIAAPATNPASDLELKLPATIGTAGQVLKNSSTAGTLEFGNVTSKIVQVVSQVYSTSDSNTTTTYEDTGLTQNITPTKAANKIIIMLDQHFYLNEPNGGDNVMNFELYRDSTAINYDRRGVDTVDRTAIFGRVNMLTWDHPDTTSAVTYKTKYKLEATATSHAVTIQYQSRPSTMFLIEVEI
jgi:hypothetical protein